MSGAYFSQAVADAIKPRLPRNIWNKLSRYVDDIGFSTATIEEHYEILRQILEVMREVGFSLKWDKLQLAMDEVNALGRTVREDKISIPKKAIEAMDAIPDPKTVKDLRRCAGTVSFVRQFLRHADLKLDAIWQAMKQGKQRCSGCSRNATMKSQCWYAI